MLSVFITPWMKPTFIHCAIRAGLTLGHGAQQAQERVRCGGERGVVPRDGVLGQLAQALDVAARGEELERADANVTRRDPRQHRTGKRLFASHRLTRRCDRECAGGGNAQRVHGLADQHLAKHRPDGRLAVTAASERRAARTLERDVAPAPLPVDHLAEQQRAAVAELRRESAELMACVGLGERFGAVRQCVPGEERCSGGDIERGEVETQLLRERLVEKEQARRAHGRWLLSDVEPWQLASERIVEAECSDCSNGLECCGHSTVCHTALPFSIAARSRRIRRLVQDQRTRPSPMSAPVCGFAGHVGKR